MNTQDKQFVDEMRPRGVNDKELQKLLDIIDRLEAELKEVVDELQKEWLITQNFANTAVRVEADNASLKVQLQEIVEKAEFVGLYVDYLNKEQVGDHCDIILNPGGNEITVLAGAFRRLAEELDKVDKPKEKEKDG